tara:strand:- start:812 stop:1183 length:372 start_codon:yes stop_codon:yes gene_type:complete
MPQTSIVNNSRTECNNGECVRITTNCVDGDCSETRTIVQDGVEQVDVEGSAGEIDTSDSSDSSDSDSENENGSGIACNTKDNNFAIIFNGRDFTLIFTVISLIMVIVFLVSLFQFEIKGKRRK